MFTKNFKTTALVLSLALLTSSDMFATTDMFEANACCNRGRDRHHVRIEPAQAIYDDTALLVPVLDQPIPFTTEDFRTNFEVNNERSIFTVEVAGLYVINTSLSVTVPAIGDTVSGYITINDRKLLPFFSSVTAGDTVVELDINAQVYLRRGDRISVILSEFTPGTTVSTRTFSAVVLNNSR